MKLDDVTYIFVKGQGWVPHNTEDLLVEEMISPLQAKYEVAWEQLYGRIVREPPLRWLGDQMETRPPPPRIQRPPYQEPRNVRHRQSFFHSTWLMEDDLPSSGWVDLNYQYQQAPVPREPEEPEGPVHARRAREYREGIARWRRRTR